MNVFRWFLPLLVLLALSPAAQAQTCTTGDAGTTRRVEIGGTGRSMLIHLPTGYRTGRRAALVWLFHGSGGSGEAILRQSRLAEAADRHGFIVAAPDGGLSVQSGFVWNIPGVPTITGKIPGRGDADDVAFVLAASDWLAAERCADPARVYATGLSGGGRMTSWLACVAADRFAAIAPVVGLRAGNPLASDPRLPDPATCAPSAPMPVIAFAGDADTVNPIQGGGTGYWQYTMHMAQARWADLNGCRSGPGTRDLAASLYEMRYTGCRGGADVVGRIERGGKHVWLADNDAMWAFLSRFRRR
ncbi:alpha/beta hydrolase family esterase [Sphingomonas soli]|uniref:alpha/beta hydrolase family esterase n=1 Tax=Sphingomonas soli TaxID=266127 RepID=UPI00082A13F8|nr:PHB depolymerase family esterase [Sphingomonas soli]